MKNLIRTLTLLIGLSTQAQVIQDFPITDDQWLLHTKTTTPTLRATSWVFPDAATGIFAGYYVQDLRWWGKQYYTSSPNGKGKLKSYDRLFTTPLHGRWLVATFNITADSATLWHHHENRPGLPANCRLFFQGGTASIYYGSRWWANPIHYRLHNANGTSVDVTLAVDLEDATQWSNVNGLFATAALAEWRTAKENCGWIGLTFGGGPHFGHGVNVSGGTATFTLLAYYTAE